MNLPSTDNWRDKNVVGPNMSSDHWRRLAKPRPVESGPLLDQLLAWQRQHRQKRSH
jgi:hypothetical protein